MRKVYCPICEEEIPFAAVHPLCCEEEMEAEQLEELRRERALQLTGVGLPD